MKSGIIIAPYERRMSVEFLYYRNGLLVGLLIFVVLLACAAVCYGAGKRFFRRAPTEREKKAADLTQTAMLTLLALLLAFGVSMAESRFEVRKQNEINEANAIGTSYLRAELLPSPSREKLKAWIKQYLQLRIDFYSASTREARDRLRDETLDVESKIWQESVAQTVAMANRSQSALLAILLQSFNQTFDLADTQTFAFRNHVPDSIIDLLIVASVIVLGMVGFVHGVLVSRHSVATIALAGVVALTLFVIIDLDRPQAGTIQIGPDSLLRQRASIEHAPKT